MVMRKLVLLLLFGLCSMFVGCDDESTFPADTGANNLTVYNSSTAVTKSFTVYLGNSCVTSGNLGPQKSKKYGLDIL
jgi:hypothetical protein